MKKFISLLRGLGYICWQTRHLGYHVLIGLLWVWILGARWGELSIHWFWIAAIGSLLPDIDHFIYWFTYGKNDKYPKQIFTYVRAQQWRKVFQFIATGHKKNTSLTYHNVYVMGILICGALIASLLLWRVGVVLFGAMVSHYIFDMCDDIVLLGSINPNWKRWGRPKQ